MEVRPLEKWQLQKAEIRKGAILGGRGDLLTHAGPLNPNPGQRTTDQAWMQVP